ncbi:MAG: KEOPS complex N(6)-L-threonylcarbamoyladenine synthase Kae1 [Thermoprotei archaeon]
MSSVVLGLESTAHTFGVGLCSLDGDVLLNSSHTFTTREGGIHPREAAQHHQKYAPLLIQKALDYIEKNKHKLVGVAFSQGPGLGPCLRIGAVAARSISLRFGIPLIGVNHSIAHIEIARKYSLSKDPITLFVSGGNTAVVDYTTQRYAVLGETLDISVGNLLDVFARNLGFGFPGTPKVLELAEKATKYLGLPYSVKGQDMSFSGLLTAARRLLNRGEDPANLSYSVVETAFSMLTEATERVLILTGKREIALTGGVARARRLIEMLEDVCKEHGSQLTVVPPSLAGDNGAMIAYVGSLLYQSKKYLEIEKSRVLPRWRIEEVDIPWRKYSDYK